MRGKPWELSNNWDYNSKINWTNLMSIFIWGELTSFTSHVSHQRRNWGNDFIWLKCCLRFCAKILLNGCQQWCYPKVFWQTSPSIVSYSTLTTNKALFPGRILSPSQWECDTFKSIRLQFSQKPTNCCNRGFTKHVVAHTMLAEPCCPVYTPPWSTSQSLSCW